MHVCTTGLVVSASSHSSTLDKTPFSEFILWDSLMNIFLRTLDVVFSLFYALPQEQRWEWCQGLRFPPCCFTTVQPPLLTLLWVTGNPLVMAFGWQAGIQLFLQKLICPVDSASRIRIPEYSPNDHTANFESISASSQLLKSKSVVSSYFSRWVFVYPKCHPELAGFRGWRWRGWDCPLPRQERHYGAAVCFCSPLDYLVLCRGMGNGFSYRGFSLKVCQKFL